KVQKGINTSYADYAAHKYQYEVKLREMNKKEIRSYVVFLCSIMLAISIIGILNFRLRVVRRMNQLDALTQIFNRGYFNKKFETLKKQGCDFYLVMFDIDNFKKINDTYGHVYGDYVIKTIAQITKKTLGKDGNVFRYGGEEFAIIFEKSNHTQVIEQVEAVRKAVEVFEWDMSCKVTVSIGVSYNESREMDVINEADRWLYEAKRRGKNRVCYQ
ncbi:MAG: GGDEF domain-containing protein, partial [Cellulosilyticum sp.]|nr:GGDEF domain-containing protein [Cellulosilyticum sp.]